MKSTYALLSPPHRRIELSGRELEPHDDQVLVHIASCGICRGDLIAFEQPRLSHEEFGHEPVGQVVAVGPWVTGLREGDWVVGSVSGGFASLALGRESGLIPLPESLREVGGLVEPLKCVTTVARAASPSYSESVAVVGCGFMGLGAIAALAHGWHSALIAVELDATRRQLALDFGATHAVDPRAGDPVEQVREITGSEGVHAVIDFANHQAATNQAARLLRTRGRFIAASGYLPQDQGMALYARAITIHAAPPAFSPDGAADFRQTIAMMAAGRYPLDRLLTHRFPLSGIQQAFETSLSGDGGRYLKGIIVNDV